MEASLRIENLTKKYPTFTLDNVDITLPKGAIMGLVGENGAGKSTIIKSIFDIIKRDQGTIYINGVCIDDDAIRAKSDVGVVFDKLNFHKTLTPMKIERIMKNVYKTWDSDLYYSYLDRFQLDANKESGEFSKGMQMKLSIAIALSHHPKLLVLDEATTGLDPIIRDEVLDIFLEFVQDEEKSILLSSHITTDLEKIADYITFIHEGRIMFSKSKDEIIYQYGIVKCDEEQFNKLDKKELIAWRKHDLSWSALVDNRDDFAHSHSGYVVDNATIEDVMLLYVKGELL